ncbi:complement receptor type 1-like [Alligator mississippiensis]|uniref:Complement receptor type 1-like n=1 Tax=Alligator mississippiensis TaxID=8496 RepID=A0A151MJS1_ALLMI|nr:complement receptor type 1-like [Alligator mississippiensis]
MANAMQMQIHHPMLLTQPNRNLHLFCRSCWELHGSISVLFSEEFMHLSGPATREVSACPRIVIKNGKATRASGHYSKYYATCDEGYRLNGPNVLICDQYDKWSTIPTCDLITTPAPPTTTPLTTTPLTTTPLTTTPLTTTPLTTTPLTTTPLTTTPLTTTPLTTTPLTTTSVTEPLPTPDNQTELYIPNGRIIAGPKPPYLIGDNVTIQCYPGFTMYGEPRIQYIGGNQWEPGIPSCRLNVFAIIIISGTLIGAVSLASFKAYKKYFPHEVVPATDDGAEAKDYMESRVKTLLSEQEEANCTWRARGRSLFAAVRSSTEKDMSLRQRPIPPTKLCGHPGDLPDGSVHIETDLSFGSTVTFSCNEGYRLIGPQFARCEIAGKGVHWNEEIPHCQSIPCLPPPDIENGKHSGEQEDYTYGASVTYKCNNVPRGSVPFSLIGEATIYCRSNEDNNGVWSAPAPQCKVVKCPEPAVPNGRRETAYSPDYIYRSRVIMKCLPDYVMIGSDVIECQENNTWHPELPVCLRMSCDHPGDLQHGSVHTETGLGVNSTVTFSCNDGYRLIGPQSIRCVLFSKHLDWDRPIPHCQPIPCLPPPDIENGKHSGEQENYTYGASVTYKCNDVPRVVKCPEPAVPNGRRETAYSPDYIYRSRVTMKCLPGYVMIGSDVIECQEDNTWHPGLPVCQTKLCGHPGDLPDGSVRIETDLSFGSTVTFSCNEGYRLIGRSSVQCVIDSTGVRWSNRLPECTRIPCLPPPDIENGKHSGEQEDYTYGASVTYKCNDVPRGSVPFSLIGEATIHCSSDAEENGVWSAPAPRCKVVKCAEPAVPNGRRETAYSPNYIYRSRVIMKCLPGYVMIGSDAIECQEDNTWHPELPVCQTTVSVSSASTPTATVLVIAHGRIIDGPKPPYAVGDSITIECDAGYTLHGEAKIQYVGGNQWKPGIPSCHLKEGLSTGVIVTLCIVFGK